MPSSSERSTWKSAAAAAGFTWYAPVGPHPLQVWAGGFGWDPPGPSLLEVCARCNDVEISVESRVVDERLSIADTQRWMVHELLWQVIVADGAPLSLPMTIELEPDDRQIAVDGVGLTFVGVRFVGSDRWTGFADVDGVRVKIATSGSLPNLAIAASAESSLPEFPPR